MKYETNYHGVAAESTPKASKNCNTLARYYYDAHVLEKYKIMEVQISDINFLKSLTPTSIYARHQMQK